MKQTSNKPAQQGGAHGGEGGRGGGGTGGRAGSPKIQGRHILLLACVVFALRGMAVYHYGWEHEDLSSELSRVRDKIRPSVSSSSVPARDVGAKKQPAGGAPEATKNTTADPAGINAAAATAAAAASAAAAVRGGQEGDENGRGKERSEKKGGVHGGDDDEGHARAKGMHGTKTNEGGDDQEDGGKGRHERKGRGERGRGRGAGGDGQVSLKGASVHNKGDHAEDEHETEVASAPNMPRPPAPRPPASPARRPAYVGPEGVIGGDAWGDIVKSSQDASPNGKTTLTSVYIEEISLLVNFIVRLDSAKMVLNLNVGRSVMVIAMDEEAYKTIVNMKIPCFKAGSPRVPRNMRVAVETRATLELLKRGHAILWTDITTIWTWDVGQTWLRASPDRVDVASPECGERQICRSLVLLRSNQRTTRLLEEALSLAEAGGGDWGTDNGGLASLVYSKTGDGEGMWLSGIVGVGDDAGDKLVVMAMPTSQFPVIGKDGEWEQLANSGLVWLHDNKFQRVDPVGLADLMIKDHVYFLEDSWEDRGGNPEHYFCTALSLDRILVGGRHSPAHQYYTQCEARGLVQRPPEAKHEKKGRHRHEEGTKGGGESIHLPGIGPAYSYIKGDAGEGMEVIMQLSQGRAGSTVTANMMLRSHPVCGMYFDELTWGIYRTRLASEPTSTNSPNPDMDKVLNVFFNSTQCILSTRLFGDAKGGEPGTLAAWLGKRDRFGMGAKSRGKDYFKLENQAKECERSLERCMETDIKGMSLQECERVMHAKPRQAVCAKELKFLGRVKELLEGAAARRIRFSLLYLLRDPRGNALSQLYSFSSKWFAEYTSPMTEVLKEHCKIAANDIEAMNSFDDSNGVETKQICFENMKDRPKEALTDVYTDFGPFKRWRRQAQDADIVPSEVADFAKEHIANWEVNRSQARKAALHTAVLYGQVPVGFDHHYSTDMSRIVHVDSWRDVYIRDKNMIDVWEKNPHCLRLRKISKCAKHWPNLTDYQPGVKDVPMDQIAHGTATNDKH